ncbi:hypothetical protein V6N13_056147 [Hibiscus sabdariffa]
MACPHVAAVAAYVKTFHPDWSPSAIKSALITTASPMGPSKNPDGEFSYGSGHVNPVKAINPGLVYYNAEGDNIRTVTNVGATTSTYNVTIASDSKLDVKVIPQVLSFKTLWEKKSHNVTVKGKALAEISMASASLTWSDNIHNVRSPIVIHTYEGCS